MRKLYLKPILFLFSFLFLLNKESLSQTQFQNPITLSNEANVSILTVDRADEELFQAFGHICIFIYDPVNQIDKVYSYGSFDFSTENFYWKFITGKLPYQISVSNLQYTMLEYSQQYENRSIEKQDLALSQTQKQKVFNILEENLLPENRTYQYKFFQDNCSTRIRDVFQKAMGDSLKFSTKGIEQGLSFRNWMNKNLPNTPWARFGMNLAIGHQSDVPITNEETMYIPENMRIAFNSATNGGKILVTKSRKIFTSYRPEQEKVTPFTPLLIFSILLVFGSALTYYQISKNILSTLFDTIFLIATGIFGLLILFLWFFTVHGVTMYNWNLLWALPTNIILAFMLKRKSKFVEAYLSVYQIILLLAIILGFIMSFFKSEIYPWAILPILTLLLIRVSFIKKYSKTNR